MKKIPRKCGYQNLIFVYEEHNKTFGRNIIPFKFVDFVVMKKQRFKVYKQSKAKKLD